MSLDQEVPQWREPQNETTLDTEKEVVVVVDTEETLGAVDTVEETMAIKQLVPRATDHLLTRTHQIIHQSTLLRLYEVKSIFLNRLAVQSRT